MCKHFPVLHSLGDEVIFQAQSANQSNYGHLSQMKLFSNIFSQTT